tara:strand:+ start:275 stop:658 length:384 start_codon:yes stop_codon:yes gene_type:complete
MDFWTALFLFLAGVLSHKVGSYLFFYTKKIVFFNDCAFAGLRMFKFVSDNIEKANELKYAQMKEQEIDEDEITKEREADQQLLDVWHDIAIAGIKHLLPPSLRSMLKFNNWEEAMRLLIKRDLRQGK